MKKRVIIVKHCNSEDHFADVSKMVGDEIRGYETYVAKHGKHFTNRLAKYASQMMRNANGAVHTWTVEQVSNVIGKESVNKATIGDLTYLANMAYADFYPDILKETEDCIRYAKSVVEDVDGYEGIAFVRWAADMKEKGKEIDWEDFV